MKITKELLERFSRNECTLQERAAIESWLGEDSWPWHESGEAVPAGLKEALWKKLRANVLPGRRTRYRRRVRTAVLAACGVVVVAGAAWWMGIHSSRAEKPRYASFTTGQGEYKRIVLPDSSVVFLSPRSTLRVEQPFPGAGREVSLAGEAIFEASHDARRPFTVVSGEVTTVALGTSFKVTSFPSENETRVALSYGKVIVRDRALRRTGDSLYLSPGEEAVYNNETHTIRKTVHPGSQFDYHRNVLFFKNAGIAEVVRKLSAYYGMEIRYDSLKDVHWSVSGEFDYQPLGTVLQAIAYSCNIGYDIQGDTVFLTPDTLKNNP